MGVKHSKYKNAGILFECLVRQSTAEVLNQSKQPMAAKLLKKYFVKTELGKEYKLYEYIVKMGQVSETKADIVINTVLEQSRSIDLSKSSKQKYNLIKEAKQYYDVERLLSISIPNYKVYASISNLINEDLSVEDKVSNKVTLMEYLSTKGQKHSKNFIEEYDSQPQEIKILAYNLMLEKFNNKYSSLSPRQKELLKEYMFGDDSKDNLIKTYNKHVVKIEEEMGMAHDIVKDESLKIKIEEMINMLNRKQKTDKVTSTCFTNLMEYNEFLDEIEEVEEISLSGDAGAYNTKNAFKKKKTQNA